MPARSVATTEQDLLTVAERIPEPVGTPLHDFDLVGDPLGERVRDAVIEVVQDLLRPPLKSAPGVEKLRDASARDGIDPLIEPAFCFESIGCLVDRREQPLARPGATELVDGGLEHRPEPLALGDSEACCRTATSVNGSMRARSKRWRRNRSVALRLPATAGWVSRKVWAQWLQRKRRCDQRNTHG